MCPRKSKPENPSFLPGFNPEFDALPFRRPTPRSFGETSEVVRLSVAATREGSFRLLWGARNSAICEIHSGKSRYDPDPFFGPIPKQAHTRASIDYTALVRKLTGRLHIPIVAERRSYLVGIRGQLRGNTSVELLDVLDRLAPGITSEPLREWGCILVGSGSRGPFPMHLGFITPHLRSRNAGIRGFTCSEAVGVPLDRLHGAVTRMRADFKGAPREGVYSWEGSSKGAMVPEEYIRSLGLSPEIWIRRRIARRSSVLSLSIFGARQTKGGKWEVVDITAPAALLITGTDNWCPAWRRAVYFVNRGDGLEWIVLHPACDGYPAGDSGLPGIEYEGSPARSVVSSLRTLWPDDDRVKIRWILDDKPLKNAGEVK